MTVATCISGYSWLTTEAPEPHSQWRRVFDRNRSDRPQTISPAAHQAPLADRAPLAAVGAPRRRHIRRTVKRMLVAGVVAVVIGVDGWLVRPYLDTAATSLGNLSWRWVLARSVGAHPGPVPSHRISIWLGAIKPRMLALIGSVADGWLPSSAYVGPDALTESNARIDDAAYDGGREPAAIRRLYNLTGRFDNTPTGFLSAPAALWAEQLADLTLTQGMSSYFLASDDQEDVLRFASDVVPAVRELVMSGRGPQPGMVVVPTP